MKGSRKESKKGTQDSDPGKIGTIVSPLGLLICFRGIRLDKTAKKSPFALASELFVHYNLRSNIKN